jgi:hypothetical protein
MSQGEAPMALEIVLLKRTVVLAWNQFVYAQGGDDEVHIAFASHDVIVKGSGLGPLLADVSTRLVAYIQEPSRSDRFSVVTPRFIREIVVKRVDGVDGTA